MKKIISFIFLATAALAPLGAHAGDNVVRKADEPRKENKENVVRADKAKENDSDLVYNGGMAPDGAMVYRDGDTVVSVWRTADGDLVVRDGDKELVVRSISKE